MSQATDHAGSARRRRGAALEGAILDAAWAELAAVGYQQLTMEGVAARAQTGKQVLYRRWRNRAELVIAAIRYHTGSIVDPVPDTGSLRGDVLAILRRMAHRQQDIGPDTAHGLLAEAAALPPDFFSIMDHALTTILERAADRGECTLTGLSPRVISLPAALTRYELFVAGGPVPDSTLTAIVDEVFLPLLEAKRATASPDRTSSRRPAKRSPPGTASASPADGHQDLPGGGHEAGARPVGLRNEHRRSGRGRPRRGS